MKKIYNIASALSASVFGLMLMTSCEGSDIYTVETPDWLQAKVDSIAAEKEAHKNDEPAEKTVFLTPSIIGALDNSSGFWAEHTENVLVKPGKTVYVSFTNYSVGTDNFKNFLIVLCDQSGATEYGVMRADAWGWGSGIDNNDAFVKETSWTDWDAWKNAMNGAKVDAAIINNGDGTANVHFDIHGTDGELYVEDYKGVKVDSDNLYFNFTIENAHLVFDKFFCPAEKQLSAEDNTSGFFADHTENVKVEPGQTVVSSFTNYCNQDANYKNFIIVLCGDGGQPEYGVMRADCWAWASGVDDNPDFVKECSWTDWDAWLKTMNGAKVTTYVTNNGNGTADVRMTIVGSNNVAETQNYLNIKVDSDNVYLNFTNEGSHQVFDESL